MRLMGRRLFLLCLVAISSSVGEGYIQGSQGGKLRLKKQAKVTQPKEPGHANRVRLEPILEVNPLEKFHQQQQEQLQRKKEEENEVVVEVEFLADDDVPVDVPSGPLSTSVETAVASPASEAGKVEERKQALFVSGSAFLAGFTDVLCLAQYGCFVNMMTGTLLKMTTAMANFQAVEVLVHALFVGSYMAGVAVFDKVKKKTASAEESNVNDMAPLRCVAPLVLALFATADFVTRTFAASHAVHVPGAIKFLQVPFLAMGFGVVNSAAAHATGNTIFFAMTNHLSRLATSLQSRQRQDDDAITAKSKSILRHFLTGAMVAAVLLRERQRLGVAVPPLCTSLGLLYAGLFAWYAPITPLLQRVRPLRKLGNLSRSIRSAFGVRRSSQSEMVPAQVFVDVLPQPPIANNSTRAYNAEYY